MDTLTIHLGEGVRGRIDATIFRTGAVGDAMTTVEIVRPRGQRIQYSIVADTGFNDLLVILDEDAVAARGTIVLTGNRELMAGAAKRLTVARESKRPHPPGQKDLRRIDDAVTP